MASDEPLVTLRLPPDCRCSAAKSARGGAAGGQPGTVPSMKAAAGVLGRNKACAARLITCRALLHSLDAQLTSRLPPHSQLRDPTSRHTALALPAATAEAMRAHDGASEPSHGRPLRSRTSAKCDLPAISPREPNELPTISSHRAASSPRSPLGLPTSSHDLPTISSDGSAAEHPPRTGLRRGLRRMSSAGARRSQCCGRAPR